MKNCPYCLKLNQDFVSVCERCGQSMITPQPRYAPGYEPFQLKSHLESLLSDLNMSYPNRVIDMNTWHHDRWDALGNYLCENLGYSSAYVFLNAYGFEVYDPAADNASVSYGNNQPAAATPRRSNSVSYTQPNVSVTNPVSINTHPMPPVSSAVSTPRRRSDTTATNEAPSQGNQFCMYCGTQLPLSATVCNKCGCPTQSYNQSTRKINEHSPSKKEHSVNIDKRTLTNATKHLIRLAIIYGCIGLIPLVITFACLGHSAAGAIICGIVTILFLIIIGIIAYYAKMYKKSTVEYNVLNSIGNAELSSAASLSSWSKITGIISLFFSIAAIPGWIMSLMCINKLKGYTTPENKVGFICSSISLGCVMLSPMLISMIFFSQIYIF